VSDAVVFVAVLTAIVTALVFGLRGMTNPDARRNQRGPGAGAAGAVYDMLNEDKRKAIEIIVEQRAGYRDAEHADDKPETGNAGNDRERRD